MTATILLPLDYQRHANVKGNVCCWPVPKGSALINLSANGLHLDGKIGIFVFCFSYEDVSSEQHRQSVELRDLLPLVQSIAPARARIL